MSSKTKRPFRVYSTDTVVVVGKGDTFGQRRTDIKVCASPLGDYASVGMHGYKCVHGGYIPATAVDSNRAPYCSICYPYILKLKEDR